MSRPAPSQAAAVLLKPDRRCANYPLRGARFSARKCATANRREPATLARAPEESGARAARFGPGRGAPLRQRRADTRASAASGATIGFGTWIQTVGRFRIRPSANGFESLVIPPAWTDVWICPDPRGHLQATGRDARGRKQYRYHPRWREVRDEVKYGRLIAFAQALPRIRARVTGRPAAPEPAARESARGRRPASREDADSRRQRGVRARQRVVRPDDDARPARDESTARPSASSSAARAASSTPSTCATARLARIVKACRDLPGYELFQYVDDDGRRQVIDSADVNEYLREISGQDFTAKDFRTWAGTVLAAKALAAIGDVQVDRRSEAEHRPRDRGGGEAAGQHESRVAASATSTRRSSTPTWTARRSTIAQRPDEAAVRSRVIARRLRKTA